MIFKNLPIFPSASIKDDMIVFLYIMGIESTSSSTQMLCY
uniref:Uncharacterized protein n=1 Tax=Rhizophora mucronata TaxID=61149 RepID=A0A2P2PQP9_RHIMU